MKIFKIAYSDWICEIELMNFYEADEFDLGYEFEASINIKCKGYSAKTNSFYFTNKDLNEFYKSIKRLSKGQEENLVFKSMSDELVLRFNKINNGFTIIVDYKKLEDEDQLSTYTNCDYFTLEYIIKDLDTFFLSFH
ncbi:MAG: hypothetical protein ABF649_21400 [Bacillus sp. (in: firmicutes)]